MTNYNRRQVLGAGIAGLTSLAGLGLAEFLPLPKVRSRADNEWLLLANQKTPPSSMNVLRLNPEEPGEIKAVNLSKLKLINLETPFTCHALTCNPLRRSQVFASTKGSNGCVAADLESGKILNVKRIAPGRRFFGHSVYAKSGDQIFASVQDDTNQKGLILILESSSLMAIGGLPTPGIWPHQLELLGEDVILVVNQHSRFDPANPIPDRMVSVLSWIEIRSGKVLRKIELTKKQSGAGFAHFAISDDGFIVLSGGSTFVGYGPIYTLIDPHGDQRSLAVPKAFEEFFTGEILSVAMDQARGIVGLTATDGALAFWNYKSGEFIEGMRLPKPRGIAFSTQQNQFIVSSAAGANILEVPRDIDGASGAAFEISWLRGLAGNGAHLTKTYF